MLGIRSRYGKLHFGAGPGSFPWLADCRAELALKAQPLEHDLKAAASGDAFAAIDADRAEEHNLRNVCFKTFFMTFTKRLREAVRRGEITCSVRIWTRPHVRVGARYRIEEGEIEIDSIEPIGFPDITPELARESGFLGVLDLLKVAKHGCGENIYLIRFHYLRPPKGKATKQACSAKKQTVVTPAKFRPDFSPNQDSLQKRLTD